MKHLSLLAIVSALVFNSPFVQATSTPSILLVDQPGLVLMVNGSDPNASLALKVTKSKSGSGLDFGFMMGDTFSSLGNAGGRKASLVFIGGTTIDFAVRSMGADKQFGTSDDQIFRLSDSAQYANQYYSGAISPGASSEQAGTYYQSLTMLWDIDHNGIRDLKITLRTQNAYDGMRFVAAPTQVPLPAAAWLLVTGLVGLTALARRRGNKNDLAQHRHT